jgi:ketosteroid isomerase-like protein
VPLHDRSAKACDTACEMTTASDDRDMSAIGQTLRALQTAFQTRNADLLRDVYTADADWTNAFGTTLSGRNAPQVSVREVTPDVVVAKTCVEIAGQQTAAGKTLPIRRNHSLKVLGRQGDGRWLIGSEMYMDARDETTYAS